jgi:hypothetical protein
MLCSSNKKTSPVTEPHIHIAGCRRFEQQLEPDDASLAECARSIHA